MPVHFTPALIDQIIKGRCGDFASLMGMRKTKTGELQVNVFLPGANAVEVLQRNGRKVLGKLVPLHAEGLFSGSIPGKKAVPYKLRVHYDAKSVLQDDPYRFPCRIDKAEMQLFVQGQHDAAWQLLGARRCSHDDVEGVQFVLWAPAAQRVSLLCDLNGWDGRCHVLRHHAAFGLWELFVPGFGTEASGDEASYKFEVLTADQHYQNLPFDPFARRVSKHPMVCTRLETEGSYHWLDHFWQQVGRDFSGQGSAISIREAAIAASANEHSLNWKQLVPLLLEQARAEGFTHVLLTARSALVVSDQHTACGLLAPDPALGSPDDLRMFINQAHELELGVLWDVPLSSLLYSLGSGNEPLQLLDAHVLGGPLLSILLGYFSYWRESFHIDGFRVRDVDPLLHMQAPQVPMRAQKKGRRELAAAGNPFVKEWLRQLLQRLRALHPGLLMMIETAVQQEPFTQPAHNGGIGFDYRIAPASGAAPVVFDTRREIRHLLSLLQDGNRDQSLISLPWQQVCKADAAHSAPADALFRLLMLALWTLPGRKHLQLDCVLRQRPQWNPEAGHDWELQPPRGWPDQGGRLLRELNQLYQSSPCLYEVDASHEGMSVLLASGEVFAYERKARHESEILLIVLNTGATAADVEVMPGSAGQYRLRYHTVDGEEQERILPKLVQSDRCSSLPRGANHGQKLSLSLPAFSGAVYAWQG